MLVFFIPRHYGRFFLNRRDINTTLEGSRTTALREFLLDRERAATFYEDVRSWMRATRLHISCAAATRYNLANLGGGLQSGHENIIHRQNII